MLIEKCKLPDDTEIKGLYEIKPYTFKDNRGYFLETYNKKSFHNFSLNMEFVQDNMSKSIKNVLRGLHFQTKHPQGKLVQVISGKVFDVAVDLRKDSETFGKYYSVILDGDKHNMFYIPKGFAHGFQVISDEAIFSYKCTDFYDPEGEGGIIWNDPILNIDWPNKDEVILSEKDKLHNCFNKDTNYFHK